MKQKSLFLLCGPAGSGKTTWAKKQINKVEYPCAYISRDEVRAEFWVDEKDDYFAHETEVFIEFVNRVNAALQDENGPAVVFADATHLSEKARNKVLNGCDLKGVDIYAVSFELPIEQVLAQNEQRKDNPRAYVPRSAIKRMYNSYQPPTDKEKYSYKNILYVGKYAD